MILKGALAGYRIVEVPVSYHPRIGKSKISGTLKGTAGATWFILSRIVRYYFRRWTRRSGVTTKSKSHLGDTETRRKTKPFNTEEQGKQREPGAENDLTKEPR